MDLQGQRDLLLLSELDRNDPDRKDLERRFNNYTQHVDDLRSAEAARQAAVDKWAIAIQDLQEANRKLQDRIDIMSERLGDSTVGDALTLMDLLRRAAAILGIGGRA